MTEREALKLALDALEVCDQSNYGRNWVWPDTAHPTAMKNVREAIAAIKEALAQPEQEPVAVKTLSKIGKATGYWRADLVPPHIGPDSHDITPLYASPPQRKPLTRKEVLAIIDKHPAEKKTGLPMFYRDQVLDIARAIEAAHGIKGEA